MKVPSIKALFSSFPQKERAAAIAVETSQSENIGVSYAARALTSAAATADMYASMVHASKSNQHKFLREQEKENKKEESNPSQTQFAIYSNTKDPGFNKETPASHKLHQQQPLGDLRIIDPKSKEIRPKLLKILSKAFPDLLDNYLLGHGIDQAAKSLNKSLPDKDSPVNAALAELKNTLMRLGVLAEERIALDKDPDAIPQKADAQRLGEAVRDCYADAAKICEKYAKKAGNGSTEQSRLATLSALFTELKRHHLSASATPAIEAFTKAEVERMRQAVPGMVENRSGAAVNNTKSFSLDVGFGTGKLIKGQAGLEGGINEESKVDDDGDQNRWDKTYLTGKASAKLSAAGFSTSKLEGRLKVAAGTNYAETGSYEEQVKLFASHKNKDAYINKFWKSASPVAREWKNNYKKIQKFTKTWVSGANYQSASAPTHLTEKKVAKGASNTGAIHALAKMMSPELSECMKIFYPPLERPMSYAALSAPAGGAGLRGKEGTSITMVEGTLEASQKVGMPGLFGFAGGFLKSAVEGKAALIGRRKEFDVERLKPSHVLLSGAYTKDMRKSLDLWNAIETRSQADARLKSKLRLYERVKGAIDTVVGGKSGAGESHRNTPYDIDFFGPVTDIPDPFLKTICAPESNLEAVVNAVAAQCEQLGQDYETLQQNAGLLHAVSTKGASNAAKNRYAALHRAAFEKINQSAWGRADGTAASGVKLADLVSSSAKRVEFLADSYDAISTALGGAGTYLEIVKAKVAEMENPPLNLVKAIEKADASYNKTNAALVRAELPMYESSLHRYNTIAWVSVSSKNEVEGKASLDAGVFPGAESAVPAAMNATGTDVDVEFDTSSLGFTATLSRNVLTANHPNPTRSGDFCEVTLTLRGGFGAWSEGKVEQAAISALRKTRKDLDGVELTQEEINDFRDGLKMAASTIALDSAKHLVLTWKHHKFSKAGDDAWRQQYFRIVELNRDQLATSVTIPTPVPGLTVKPGMGTVQELKNPLYEMMGNDLSHHILSHVRLEELRDKAKKRQQAEMKADAELSAARDELVLLKEEFDADLYRKNQFFSTDTILNVVKDYHDFLDWKNGSPLARQPNSGFVFYDRAEIQDVAKNARRTASLAAGKSAFTVQKNEDGIDEVRRAETQSSLSDPLTHIAGRDELAAFEQRMRKDLAKRRETDPEARLTPDDRARLLLTTKEGKKVFNSYTQIVGTYKELNNVATTLLGYEGRLREEMPKLHTAHRLGGAGKRAGAALLSMFDGTGLRPSPEAGTEAANTLSQRGYFSPRNKKSYNKLPHDDHSSMHADTWLLRHGLAKAENGLQGVHSLIVALLQQATGRYNSLHAEEAARYLKMFDRKSSLSVNMRKVMSAIRRDHGDMHVHMITPDGTDGGAPAWIGDLGTTQEKGVRSVVIMGRKNAEGKDEFAAIVHRKHALASDIPEHLTQLDKAKAARSALMSDSLPGRDAGLTGTEQREAMKILGVMQRGRISNLVKNTSASLADKKRPERKVFREMDNDKLKDGVKTAARLHAGSTRYWREGVKEMKKRDNNKNMLTPAVVTRSLEEKTGKELRKEIKENTPPHFGLLSTARQMAARLKHQSKTAEVMTRLNRAELEDAVRNAKHPEIRKAAEKELDKRQKMERTLAEMKNLSPLK